MKKVLIVALRGCTSRRIFGLAKYLPEFGWQPILLTIPHLEKPDLPLRVIETSYRDALSFWKKLLGFSPSQDIRAQAKERLRVTSSKSWLDPLLTFGGAIINYPDAERGWKPFALKAANELLQEEDIQAIISSSSPVTSHLIANELKTRYRLPWLADFRDLWSQNHNYRYGPLRKWLDRRLEIKTLAPADALVTVSQPLAERLGRLHQGKSTYAITHSFDPAEINTPPAKLTTKFTITYTGTIYPGKQDPTKLLASLRDLIADGTLYPQEIEVRFYGGKHNWLGHEIKQHGLADTVRQLGPVAREAAVQRQRESQLLLVLNWEDNREPGIHTAKIFEYLAARRPILATGGSRDNVVVELLNQTRAGLPATTVEEVKSALKQMYQEFKQQDEITFTGDETEINKCSHREMASRFAEILENLAGTR